VSVRDWSSVGSKCKSGGWVRVGVAEVLDD